jgi:hypothetical protein
MAESPSSGAGATFSLKEKGTAALSRPLSLWERAGVRANQVD